MAFIIWTGAAKDGKWATAANWFIPATGAATAPGGTDDVWIPPGIGAIKFYADSITVSSIRVGAHGSQEALQVLLGSSITTTDLHVHSGFLQWLGATTNITQEGGLMDVDTGDAISSVSVHGGRANLDRHGTITTLSIYRNGFVDFTRTTIARTVTTPSMQEAGGRLWVDPTYVTFTNQLAIAYRGGLSAKYL